MLWKTFGTKICGRSELTLYVTCEPEISATRRSVSNAANAPAVGVPS